MEPVSFNRSRLRTAGFVLGGLFFVAMGYLMVTLAESIFHRAIGWITILFFGAVAISAGWSVIRSGRMFTFDRSGIVDHQRGVVIAWADIRQAVVFDVNGIRFLGLTFHEPAQFLSRLSPPRRLLAEFNERRGWCYWNFTFSGVTPGIDDALEYIRKIGVPCRD